MRTVWMTLYAVSAMGLAVYGINSIYLTVRYLRGRSYRHAVPRHAPRMPPVVTVQLPLYNEMNVVGRLLTSVLALDYPAGRWVVQLLDDSSDGTVGLVREKLTAIASPLGTREAAGAFVEEWRRSDGLLLQHIRRSDRAGYKAGALDLGMRISVTDAYAVFDADFVPAPDFLSRALAHFGDPEVAFVQTRWGHLNADQSLLTRAQALAMDAHFAIEQQARFASGLFFNFNGTAGVWRRTAIEAAGGWQARTLTEDLDLSYRAQLAGWRAVYDADVIVPGEIPRDLNALKNQQFRWAKGSLQTGRLILGRVVRAPLSRAVRVQAVVHLMSYLVHPLLLLLLLSTAFLIRDFPVTLVGFAVTAAIGLGPPLMVAVAQRSLHRDWRRRVLIVPFLAALGMGIAVVSTRAAIETLFGVRSGFVRTPKDGNGRRLADYRAIVGIAPALEWVAALTALYTLQGALETGRYSAVPFLLLYVMAFGYVGLVSLTTALRSALGVTNGR